MRQRCQRKKTKSGENASISSLEDEVEDVIDNSPKSVDADESLTKGSVENSPRALSIEPGVPRQRYRDNGEMLKPPKRQKLADGSIKDVFNINQEPSTPPSCPDSYASKKEMNLVRMVEEMKMDH